MSVVLFPTQIRQPGTYTSEPVWVPYEATYIEVICGNRENWLRLGVYEDVIELSLEMNIDGQWKILGACTTDAQPKEQEDGTIGQQTSLKVRLPQVIIPQPQLRVLVTQNSICEIDLTLVYYDDPLPERQVQEHHSVTYDTDIEVVGINVTGVATGSFAVANNTDRCMLVGVASWDTVPTDADITSVSHNGDSSNWNLIGDEVGPSSIRARIYAKVAPDVASATVSIALAGTCSRVGVNAMSVYGVDQTTSIYGYTSSQGTTGIPTVTVTSATDDMVYDVGYSGGSRTSTGGTQVQMANLLITGGARIIASRAPGEASVTMSWVTAATIWAQGACAIKAVVVAQSFVPKLFMLNQAVQRASIY